MGIIPNLSRADSKDFKVNSIPSLSSNEFDNSVEIMHDALLLYPRNVLHLNNLGISYHSLEQFIEAEKHFQRGLELEPNYINILNNFMIFEIFLAHKMPKLHLTQ